MKREEDSIAKIYVDLGAAPELAAAAAKIAFREGAINPGTRNPEEAEIMKTIVKMTKLFIHRNCKIFRDKP